MVLHITVRRRFQLYKRHLKSVKSAGKVYTVGGSFTVDGSLQCKEFRSLEKAFSLQEVLER